MGEGKERDLVIVGGGPAGMVAGLLFTRAGLPVTVLEKHGDFLRDFRGDTVHPSTLRIFHELGLLDRLLQRPHDKVPAIGARIGDRHYEIADLGFADPRWAFVAMMPQWEFLDFVASEARRYPHFRLVMNAEATGLLHEGERVSGVRYRHVGEERSIAARLVIASDGRRSVLRGEAGLKVEDLGAPMDVFWFRVPKARTAENETIGVFAPGRIIALIDRGDYWQCAFVFAKGEAEKVRARGIAAFRAEVAERAPMLAGDIDAIATFDDVKLLAVSLDRLETWHRPGLLVIGDAAHAMSPVGGIGINVAVQDAVAAANVLAGPMARGEDPDPLLRKVEKRRLSAVRLTQAAQKAVQQRIIAPLLAMGDAPVRPPLAIRLLDRFPRLRRIPGRMIGFGYRPEHVRSPVGPRHSRESGNPATVPPSRE
ncbi:FAD-dependent oxidoreductase [Allosphingosinicella sp.]|jgi:2-polyprenyl-6-methoxyphenol hydroxylase-like FAD-dependent oxidoreductase|uniref:FAD-dependent oxidoreductase n=1 Tax=Allosphingosinicella sp. TaxID=2823234 RepID=UPI002F0112B5